MSAMGTDVLAVACILGGAAVGGATTMAFVDGHHGHADMACAMATVQTAPRVVVSMDGGNGRVVVAPRVRVHASHDCMAFKVDVSDVQVNAEEMNARMDEVRARLEEARSRMQEAQARVAEAQARQSSELGAEIQKRVQKQLQAQLKRLDEQLAKLDEGSGR